PLPYTQLFRSPALKRAPSPCRPFVIHAFLLDNHRIVGLMFAWHVVTSTWNDLASSARWRGVVSFIRNWVAPFDSEEGMATDELDVSSPTLLAQAAST